MWGQASTVLCYAYTMRIIPTRVGTSGTYRVCFNRAVGSSPRVWGQVIHPFCEIYMIRIIPTRVGTRMSAWDNAMWIKDHPHACGDKVICMIPSISARGSSPRVWGQGVYNDICMHAFRIIPTRVGTSSKPSISDTLDGDHPHACGDKFNPKICIS